TGSRPFKTRIEPSAYSGVVLTGDWVAMVADCSGISVWVLDTKTVFSLGGRIRHLGDLVDA
uniref:hypothetical protein n=1 Tax=Limnohabitans sp. TaxID=1907725 RepID=UPI004048200A